MSPAARREVYLRYLDVRELAGLPPRPPSPATRRIFALDRA